MKQAATTVVLILLVAAFLYRSDESVSAADLPITQPQSGIALAYALSQPLGKHRRFGSDKRATKDPIEIGFASTHVGKANHVDTQNESSRSLGTSMPAPLLSFDGLSNFDNIAAYSAVVMPPDANGDVGPDHFVQVANLLLRVFDKSGSPLSPPIKLNQLFAELGTPCADQNDGLPVVLYDPLADRWLISQYCYSQPPFRQLVAVSATGDPLGRYHTYEFVMPNVRINDLAKFAVWRSSFLMTTEEILGSDYRGAGVFAFDRDKMLRGVPDAGFVYFGYRSPNGIPRNLMPIDLDGMNPPAADSPCLVAGYTATEYGDAADALRIFEFRPNFADAFASTFIEHSSSPLVVQPFDPTSPEGRTDITQPAPGAPLDSNSDRLAYRASYRRFDTHDSVVISHTIAMQQSPYRAGQRVYELKRPEGQSFSVEQQLTIGDAASSRWIGSAAIDGRGNIAFAYNRVTDSEPPSIVYSGRAANDQIGTLRDERSIVVGTGVQRAFGFRWGDYSSMSVDPVDDCTFWTNGQYYTMESQNFSEFTWLTRIGSFKFAECTPSPRARLSGVVRNATTGELIDDVNVMVDAYQRTTTNGAFGPIVMPPGQYTVNLRKKGFAGSGGVAILADGSDLRIDATMLPIPEVEVNGVEITAESCTVNNAPEPGESVTIRLSLVNRGELNATNVAVELLATDAVVPTSATQNYGDLPIGGEPVAREFSFDVNANVGCGASIELRFLIASEQIRPVIVAVPLRVGVENVTFRETFDRTQFAGLPPRWTRSNSIPELFWTISASRTTTQPKAAFSNAPIRPGWNEIVTPAIRIATSQARLTFQNWYELETTFLRNRLYDGSVLELSIDGGAWTDVIDAGGIFESGGYDGEIDGCCQNPLAGRQGWSGRSGIGPMSVFVTTSLRLPNSLAGREVRFRWRIGTDIGGFREGQYIDDVTVIDGFRCGCSIGGSIAQGN